jgi:hypothetical protein
MAISWLTAFKAIPWGDVIAAAPTVAQGAKKLWGAVGRGDAGSAAAPGSLPADAEGRLRTLEAQIAGLQRDNAASSELIKSLAEQNSRLVDAVEILRVRTRALLALCLALAVILAGLALWLLWR